MLSARGRVSWVAVGRCVARVWLGTGRGAGVGLGGGGGVVRKGAKGSGICCVDLRIIELEAFRIACFVSRIVPSLETFFFIGF